MGKQAKHICIVSPSLKIGGIERALTVLSNYFVSQGYEVTFISCLTGDRFYTLDKRIHLIEPVFKRNSGQLNKFLFYPRVAGFIRKQTIKVRPDVVLTFGDWFSPLVLFALIGSAIPVYISDRTSPDYAFGIAVRAGKRIFYPGSAGFIAQTKRSADYKLKQFGDKLNIRVIPNAIREVTLYNIPREKIILYVGRFAWEKGPERLIEAFAMIEEKRDWRLVMAGSGPMLEPMKALVMKLDIADMVDFLGKVENVDLLYSRAGIYVLPSVLEGFPNSLCEAMAAGLPSVCFDSLAYEDIFIPGSSGMVVEKDNISGLASALKLLINDPDERNRIGQNARLACKQFDVNSVGERVLDFIFDKK
ncbi:MAG: glycosyltransferase [Bacteroidota bacterium]